MRFGPIDNFILFGGEQRLINFTSLAKGYTMFVVSAPRLLQSRIEGGMTVAEHLRARGIPAESVLDLESFPIDAHLNERTLGLSFGAPWIFRREFIEKFKGRLLNAHGTRLPKNRGGASFSWQIMRGERTGAHLLHLVDAGVDTGNIIFCEIFEFPESCRTPKDYKDFFMAEETEFFKKFLRKIAAEEEFPETMQDESRSTYFPRLSTLHHGWIDWSWSAADLERFICAFDVPHEGASTLLEGKHVFLRGARADFSEGAFHPFMSGLVFCVAQGRVFVAARDGAVSISGVFDESGNDIRASIRAGSRFTTPSAYLDDARVFKAVYTPRGLKTEQHGRQTFSR